MALESDDRIIFDMSRALMPKYRFQNLNNAQKSGVIFDCWSCGPACKDAWGEKLDGAYPAGFIDKIKMAFYFLFKDLKREEILFVCSGRVPKTEGMRLDIDDKYKPDFLCNAEFMEPIKDETFKFTTSDTPYNKDASEKYYDKPMLNKSKVLKEMERVTKIGGFVSVLDESFPVSPPRSLLCVARIAVSSVPNLTWRAFTVFKKLEV